MNDKELFELAEKCGVVITYGQGVPLKAFYRAAFNAGLEAAAREAMKITLQWTHPNGLFGEVARLKGQVVSGFYEERVPQFRQGIPVHELEEEVTAEEVTGYVARIEALRERNAKLLGYLLACERAKSSAEVSLIVEEALSLKEKP